MAIIDIYTRVISGDIVTDPRYIMGKYAWIIMTPNKKKEWISNLLFFIEPQMHN